MTDDRARLSDWNRPTQITITTPGTPTPAADSIVSYPMVKRRVATGRTLSWHGIDYAEGSIVTMGSDVAHPHEMTGVLVKLDGQL